MKLTMGLGRLTRRVWNKLTPYIKVFIRYGRPQLRQHVARKAAQPVSRELNKRVPARQRALAMENAWHIYCRGLTFQSPVNWYQLQDRSLVTAYTKTPWKFLQATSLFHDRWLQIRGIGWRSLLTSSTRLVSGYTIGRLIGQVRNSGRGGLGFWHSFS